MSHQEKDIVIDSLEFARGRLLKGEFTSRQEFSNFLIEKNYILPNDVDFKKHLITALYEQIFSFQDPNFTIQTRFMSMDAYLGLIDHEELQLAREDSARAREEAKFAIEHAEEATLLTKKALFWTKVSVILATVVGIIQIIVAFNY